MRAVGEAQDHLGALVGQGDQASHLPGHRHHHAGPAGLGRLLVVDRVLHQYSVHLVRIDVVLDDADDGSANHASALSS